MLPVLKEVIKTGVSHKGAHPQDTSGRGCAWYADPNPYYSSYPCRLYTS